MATRQQPSSDVFRKYLRPNKKFPSVWCPGCGNGIVQGAIIRAIERLGYDKDNIAMVSGIGCSSRLPVYLDFTSMHTTHGRALAFATGVKFAKPHLKVIVITGDGDALAIGGNHFIHACRRNIDITTILINNNIYGMTGGQGSPTTPCNDLSTTAPSGTSEQPFDPCNLAIAAGASFVGRTTVFHAPQMENMMMAAFEHRGFSLIEAISNCHTYFGKLNDLGGAASMVSMFRETAVNLGKSKNMSAEELDGKVVIGTLHQSTRPEFCDNYQRTIDQLSESV